ncbi:MAG: hypothetical protein LBH36_01685 [Candidatus Nomurabacteria bacterium]|jgi:hypothetical protein|nr:hypothetical protein [Candidatus Nomurabacteria bacterium]
MGKHTKKSTKDDKKSPKKAIAGFIHGMGRVFMFFGFVSIILALVVFWLETFTTSSPVTTIAGGSVAASENGIGQPLAAIISTVAVAAVAIGMVYMFYIINKWVKLALEFIIKYTKQSMVMLEVSFTFMLYMLGAALLASIFQNHMAVVFIWCGTGAAVALACFVVAHILAPEKPINKTKE